MSALCWPSLAPHLSRPTAGRVAHLAARLALPYRTSQPLAGPHPSGNE